MLLNGQIQSKNIGVRLNGGTADIAIQRKTFTWCIMRIGRISPTSGSW
jgi:hypothetical protein